MRKVLHLSVTAKEWVDLVFATYITDMINDQDEVHAKKQILDIMRAEVREQLRVRALTPTEPEP